MQTFILLLLGVFLTLVPHWGLSQEGSPTPAAQFRVKLDLADIPLERTSLEVEWIQGAYSLELQGGVIGAFWNNDHDPRLYGWFLRGGPKFYFQKAPKGFALKPEAVFAAWKDPEAVRQNLIDLRVRDFGVIVNLGYTWRLGERLMIEPSLGLGYLLRQESGRYANDVGLPPGPEPAYTDFTLYPYDAFEQTPFGISLADYLHGVFGLKLGYSF